ncbi:SurA N-terminal domain-containing protein [Pseudaminobacter sp. 19-2017]|uniref:Parvulin-like PPIase n=1 Tax=Pseudaminobacter soli (ex Zhang et al. 2022) TaxID=2831468 RepID=A0A942IAH3_9HYPH|nr:SurA N-terminal domain-containing protein [Pseudaminobacter soli]MBS3651335.1 SurA N-terminal domain-containing protein [Pseudaminobacter soli]
MLDSLRKAAGTWIAKLLLLLLVVSFAVWGISGQLHSGLGGNKVITAGGTSVSPMEYRLAYDRQINLLSQRFGQRLTREQATSLGVDNQVLGQLVSGAVLDEQARKLGLGLSKDRLAVLTAQDPAFQGPDGGFDRQRFDYVLRQIGMRPEDYLNSRAQVAVRQQIVEAVADGIKAPDALLRAVALYQGEDRTAEYLTIPRSVVEPVEPPSDDVLSGWFEEHKKQYAAPEYRKISYVRLNAEDIADAAAVSEDQVKADYEKNKARFTTPETRAIQQLVFPSKEAAEAAVAALKNATPFEKIIEEQGKTLADVQLGELTKENVPDRKVADAAFSLNENEVSGVVEGSFGPVLVRVTKINPEVVKPYEAAKDEIRKDLALGEAHRVLLDVHDSYEDARAGGATMAEAAEKMRLKVATIDAVDRAGQRPDGTMVNDIPQSSEVLRAAFDSEVGVENAAIPSGKDGYVYYEVEGITPARDRTFDEVKDKVAADWTKAEAERRLTDKVTELEKRLKDGTPLETIAAELTLEKQTKRGLKREAEDADFGRDGVDAVFSVALNGVGSFAAPAGDARVLFKVTEVFEPAASGPDALPENMRRQYASDLADDLLDQLVLKLQTEYEVRVDRNAISQALAF